MISPDSGQLVTYQDRDPKSGQIIDLPMSRDAAKAPPPCDVCPKHIGRPPGEPRKPLPAHLDFGPWVYDVIRFARTGRVLGFPPGLDPMIREACMMAVEAINRSERRSAINQIVTGILSGMRGART